MCTSFPKWGCWHRLPDKAQWIKAYQDNPTMSSIISFSNNPGSTIN
jgi:hypothetical protein